MAAFLVNAAKKNTTIASIFCSVGRFILDIINHVSIYFTTSTTFNDLLCHCGLIDKSLSKLQGIVSHDDFGKPVQFSKLIHRTLAIATTMESDDKLLKEDPRVKLIQLTELTKNYEAIIAK